MDSGPVSGHPTNLPGSLIGFERCSFIDKDAGQHTGSHKNHKKTRHHQKSHIWGRDKTREQQEEGSYSAKHTRFNGSKEDKNARRPPHPWLWLFLKRLTMKRPDKLGTTFCFLKCN